MEVAEESKACIWKGCRKATPSILDLGNLSVQKVALGSSHYAVLFHCGKLLMFGNNQHGQLGVGDNFSTLAEPMPGHFFIDVACGKDHTASVGKDGSVFCWGSNLHMQCGCPEKQDFIAPHNVDIGNIGCKDVAIKIIQVGCGHFHTLALSESGIIWSWGSGAPLGLGKIHFTHIPLQIDALKSRKVLSVACGAFHSIAIISSDISSFNNLVSEKLDDASILVSDMESDFSKDVEAYQSAKDKRSRLSNSHSLSDVQNTYVPTIGTSTSFSHKFELELKSCPCPIIQTIQETPDQTPGLLLSRSPISELMMDNEVETSFVDACNLKATKEEDVRSVCLLDDNFDAESDLISLGEDDQSDLIPSNKDDSLMLHQLSLDNDETSKLSSIVSSNSAKRISSLEEKDSKSNAGWNSIQDTCSSFLDEFKAKEFLQRQLECVNPLVIESLPGYGSAIQSKIESASSAVKMLTSNDPLSKKFETLLQHVPSPPGAVQEYVSQLTRTVVSNLKISVDKIVSTAPIEAITEGVSGGVMEVVKMAKRKSLGETKESCATDIVHLCVKNSALNRSEAVSKSTSMNPIEAGKQTHHRNVSLPTGTLESLPVFRHESRLICWDTEVWSWGQGSKGQLGLGDTVDRDVPHLMGFFSHEHISQLSAGHSHNIALSHSGQVFVWGDNSNNQLGQQNIVSSSSPLILELQGGLPCWSVAAGDKHTLIACDGIDNSTQVFYCGYDPSCSDDKLTHVKQMMSVSDLKLFGAVQEIYSGGEMSSCLVRAVRADDVVRNAVYDLSCSERFFCLTLKRIIATFLQPLIQKLDVSECNGLMVGAIKTESPAFNSHWSHCFRLLFSKLSCLQQLVARNQCDLKHWLRMQPSDPRTVPFTRDPEKFVTAYASYFKAYCDAVSCLCFKSCVQNNKDFFDMISDDFLKFLEDDKISPLDASINLQNLTKLPYFRLRDYQKTLDKIAGHYPAYSSVHADLQRVLQMWRRLRQSSDNDLSTAAITASYWKSANPKLLDALRTVPSRRLVRDGKIFPLNLNSGGGPRLFSWSSFVLFNDCFVQIQYSNHIIFPLQTVWLEISPDSKTLKNAITLTMPEEIFVLTAPTHSEKAEWVWCLQQTIKSSLGAEHKNMEAHCIGPPIERHATYTFQKSGWLKDATYVGQWRNALMHGKGELKWSNGRKYMGSFVNGQMEGHGTMTTPCEEGMEVQDGTWKAGHLHGYGVVRYSNGDVYRGYFVDGKRQGHGIMKQGKFTTTSASIYYGHWLADKRSGYGVFDDIPRGQKYMGQWLDDNRHGNGLVVTLDGFYFEGNFTNGKMSGKGLFVTEDNHFYEGDFSGFAFSGKGILTFPNGDFIEGSFGGNFSDGVKINGTLRKGCEGHDLRSGQNMFNHHVLPQSFGKMAYPAEEKWEELYKQCYSAIGCSRDRVNEDCSEVWNKVASFMTHFYERKSPSLKRNTNGGGDDDDMNIIPSFCQHSISYPVWKNIKTYLAKAFEHPHHPLGFLLSSLVDVYLATYVGINAHVRLLVHATLELKAYVENIYSVVRHLFPKLPVTTCLLPVSEDMHDADEIYRFNRFRVTPQALLHPIIIPKVYPPLYNLFVIHNEKNDDKYWRRASLWNKQPDQALMTYLDVDRKYHPSCDSLHENNDSRQCYQEAVECLQRISISFTPLEKMLQIHAAFHEINLAVKKSLGKCPQWSMDELFPVFWFVVVRSRIQHLGAEIHFIEELMDKHLENGELGLMFTTLKACYFQILNEKPV